MYVLLLFVDFYLLLINMQLFMLISNQFSPNLNWSHFINSDANYKLNVLLCILF